MPARLHSPKCAHGKCRPRGEAAEGDRRALWWLVGVSLGRRARAFLGAPRGHARANAPKKTHARARAQATPPWGVLGRAAGAWREREACGARAREGWQGRRETHFFFEVCGAQQTGILLSREKSPSPPRAAHACVLANAQTVSQYHEHAQCKQWLFTTGARTRRRSLWRNAESRAARANRRRPRRS